MLRRDSRCIAHCIASYHSTSHDATQEWRVWLFYLHVFVHMGANRFALPPTHPTLGCMCLVPRFAPKPPARRLCHTGCLVVIVFSATPSVLGTTPSRWCCAGGSWKRWTICVAAITCYCTAQFSRNVTGIPGNPR